MKLKLSFLDPGKSSQRHYRRYWRRCGWFRKRNFWLVITGGDMEKLNFNEYRKDDIERRIQKANFRPLDMMVTGVTGPGGQ